jgi:predicted transcriptional regulator
MAHPAKIDPVKLRRYIREGKSQRQIAKIFNVSDAAVSMRRKDLNLSVAKCITLEHGHACVLDSLDVVQQLHKMNEEANFLLDLLMGAIRGEKDANTLLKKHQELGSTGVKMRFEDPKALALKVMSQIQNQLKLQISILESLSSFESIAGFQNEVIKLIEEMDLDLKKKFIAKLREKKAIRSAITL